MENEQDYLIHYGVLNMKWGVRKDNYTSGYIPKGKRKRDITKKSWGDRKTLKKYDRLKKKKNSNTKTVDDKFQKELNNSKEAKEFKKYSKMVERDSPRQSSKIIPGEVFTKYWNSFEKLEAKQYEIERKYQDKYASAFLKDLNYADTKKAREWVKDRLRYANYK